MASEYAHMSTKGVVHPGPLEGCISMDCNVPTGFVTFRLEQRSVCDECGATFGVFHKNCEGRWVTQHRTVSEWMNGDAHAG